MPDTRAHRMQLCRLLRRFSLKWQSTNSLRIGVLRQFRASCVRTKGGQSTITWKVEDHRARINPSERMTETRHFRPPPLELRVILLGTSVIFDNTPSTAGLLRNCQQREPRPAPRGTP